MQLAEMEKLYYGSSKSSAGNYFDGFVFIGI